MGKAIRKIVVMFCAVLSVSMAASDKTEAKAPSPQFDKRGAEAAGYDLPDALEKRANDELVKAMRERLRRIKDLVEAKEEITKLKGRVSELENSIDVLRREYEARGVEMDLMRSIIKNIIKEMDEIIDGGDSDGKKNDAPPEEGAESKSGEGRISGDAGAPEGAETAAIHAGTNINKQEGR